MDWIYSYAEPPNSAVLRTLPFGSLNRWICGSLRLAQISQGETSRIPGTLSDIPLEKG